MCDRVEYGKLEKGMGYFMKGNEPEPIVMSIVVGSCQCGENFYGRVENGFVWVKLEPEPQDVDYSTIKAFSKDYVRARGTIA